MTGSCQLWDDLTSQARPAEEQPAEYCPDCRPTEPRAYATKLCGSLLHISRELTEGGKGQTWDSMKQCLPGLHLEPGATCPG